MAKVAVLLDATDHWCCGPVRRVGDDVSMSVHNTEGVISEERHDVGVDLGCQTISGRIVAMAWRPIVIRVERGLNIQDGYGGATSISSTEDDVPDNSDWAFEFTLETKDRLPDPHPKFSPFPAT